MDFKKIVPHLIAFFVLLIVAFARFAPIVFEGKTLQQGDNLQSLGMQGESRRVEAKTGEYPLWTNAAFSGMPTYQILYPTSNPMKFMQKAFLLGNDMAPPHTGILLMMLGVYFLLVVMNVDWRLSIIGAIGFGLAANHMDLVQAGHSTKVIAAAYCAPILAGLILSFRGKYWLGGGLTALFVALQIYANHVQITYYFFLSLLIFGVVYLIDAVKNGWLPRFGTAVGVSAVAVLLAVGTNASRLMTTKEYADETIRGKSELTQKGNSSGSTAEEGGGLSKDYAFQYSYGINETWNLLIPNYLGGSSSEGFASDSESATIAALRSMKNSEEAMQYAQQTTHYWGGQPFVGGGVYMGMVFTLLFFMGMFLVKKPIRWYALGTVILAIMISWGSNFPALNYLLFDHLPLFNKFRDPKMFLIIANMLVVAFGILGLQAFFDKNLDQKERQKGLLLGGAVTAGLLLIAFIVSLGFDYQKPGQQFPQALADALAEDRKALLMADLLRSFLFAGLAFGLLWVWVKKSFAPVALTVGLGLLAVIDIWGVGARMLSSDDFINTSQKNSLKAPTAADDEILKDRDPHFRVADFRRGLPFSNAFTGYHHQSVGGYHAAKLMRYQEVIERYLNDPTKNQRVYGMLNTKYFINQQEKALTNPSACGNAWFVKEIKTVANGDAEIDALADLDPKVQAVVQESFATNINGFTPSFDSSATISLTHYHPDTMIYKYSAVGDQFAVFSEVYYPPSKGWKMFLDGQPTNDFIKCNFVLRGAKLPAGQHELKMIFAPKSYYTGETIALIAGLLVIGLAVWGIVWFGKNYQLPEAGHLPISAPKERAAAGKVRTEPRRKK
ncbi:MAG: hypothetical protein K9J37_11090 [Saprospiraceae bacterium]|nr:hypothetical protein [Saprospiraceae bacterium]MCF8250451.1 hypothetical protein [Saprospiraceae bacterium]MCF8282108.1 hypothetical protein [Bacteroidales bacterium]MCF8312403.1 hypothetical protein [Saprospiraceae bacterium]MCF8440600.1 hypothetical protein [Saprospiraceae bacterium]